MNELHIELFTLIYKKYFSYIVHFIGSYIDNDERAKEIAQDVFISFWVTICSENLIQNEKMILGLLLTIAKNKSLNSIKRNNHFRKYKADMTYAEKCRYLNLQALESDFSTNIYEREVIEIISSTISRMDERLKSTLILSRIEGLKNKEVAHKQGISVRAVENRLRNALDILRMNLKDYYKTKES